jgi:hypothetical protein
MRIIPTLLIGYEISRISCQITLGRRRRQNYFMTSNSSSSGHHILQVVSVPGCIQQGVDFTSTVLNSDGTQKCFVYLTPDNKYTFKFTIPICGSSPSSPCNMPAFSEGTMGQYPSISGNPYNLGNTTGSISFSAYQGANAILISYDNGDPSGCAQARMTSLYIVCDSGAGALSISTTEQPSCVYTVVFATSTSNICSILNSVSPTSYPTVIPSVNPTAAPTLDCHREGIDLGLFLTDYNGVQNCFVSPDSQYFYAFTIPACGTIPAYCSSFGTRDIGQIGSQFGQLNYNLGTYTESWNTTTYLNQPALSVLYVDGTFCPHIGNRSSTVYVLCDRTIAANNVMHYETNNCSYSFVVYTPDYSVCAVLSPQTSQAPSPAPTYATSPPGPLGGYSSSNDPYCPCNQ